MNIGIMQPYFFPYIGYWQLLNAVDTFVIYDDVNFIKKGYINRNNILINGSAQRITLEVIGASQNKIINEVNVGNNKNKLIKSIEGAYKKSPEYERVFPLIKMILEYPERNLGQFLGNSIYMIADYLEINATIIYSSDLQKNSNLKAQEKILNICECLGATKYINSIGGKELYDKEYFQNKGISLKFLETELIGYKQYKNEFVPHLSIIDIMMFNSRENIKKMLNSYQLV